MTHHGLDSREATTFPHIIFFVLLHNGRSGPRSVVSRIDKFLVTQELDSRRGKIEATPSERKMLDHSPLVMTIKG
jgi:exonuclease III